MAVAQSSHVITSFWAREDAVGWRDIYCSAANIILAATLNAVGPSSQCVFFRLPTTLVAKLREGEG